MLYLCLHFLYCFIFLNLTAGCNISLFHFSLLLRLQERLLTLKKQAAQITQQAQREKESFLKERSNLEAMLQRVQGYPWLHVYACDHPCFCVWMGSKAHRCFFNVVFHFRCFIFCLLGERKPHHSGKKIC